MSCPFPRRALTTLALVAFALPAAAQAPVSSGPGLSGEEALGTPSQPAVALHFYAQPADDDGRGTPFKVDKDDNICGLTVPRQLTNPAKVDYEALLDETPEVQEIKRNKIDPASAKGIELLTKARARVRDACEEVRGDKGYCSIWKQIVRRDGRPLADVTDTVKTELKGTGFAGGLGG